METNDGPDAVLYTGSLTKSSHQPSEETSSFPFYRNPDSSGSVLGTGAVVECDPVQSGARGRTLFRQQGDGGHGSNKVLRSAVNRGEVPTSRGRQDRKRGATEPCPKDRTPGLPSRRAGQGGWGEALQAHTPCPRPPANPETETSE